MEEIPSSKRGRSPDITGSSSANDTPEVAPQVRNETTSRPIAGSQRVSTSQYSNSTEITPDPFNFGYSDAQWGLPFTSNELGGMPIHHDMDMNFDSDNTTYQSKSSNSLATEPSYEFSPGRSCNNKFHLHVPIPFSQVNSQTKAQGKFVTRTFPHITDGLSSAKTNGTIS